MAKPVWDDSLIRVDTREQAPLWEVAEKATLHTGDYAVVGYEDKIAVERKSIADLLGSLGGKGGVRRKRFEAEFARLGAMPRKAVVIEGTISAIYKAPRFGRIGPSHAIGAMFSWEQKYGVPVHFVESRMQARAVVKLILRQAWEALSVP